MNFAPTLPAAMYPELDHGEYHLVQAHHLADTRDDVIDWFRERGHGTGHVTILDNGVMELDEPDMESLVWAANVIKPSVVVCPDAFCDCDETIRMFHEYVGEVCHLAPTIIVVPHGVDLLEWRHCAHVLFTIATNMKLRFVAGIPKVLSTYSGGRWTALAWMESHWPDVGVHLLGTWQSIDEPIECNKWFDNILGFDSTLPYAHALSGCFTSDLAVPKMQLDQNDWNAQIGDVSMEALWQAEMNIATCRKLLGPTAKDVPYARWVPRWATALG